MKEEKDIPPMDVTEYLRNEMKGIDILAKVDEMHKSLLATGYLSRRESETFK